MDFGAAPGAYIGAYEVSITAMGVAEMRAKLPPTTWRGDVDRTGPHGFAATEVPSAEQPAAAAARSGDASPSPTAER